METIIITSVAARLTIKLIDRYMLDVPRRRVMSEEPAPGEPVAQDRQVEGDNIERPLDETTSISEAENKDYLGSNEQTNTNSSSHSEDRNTNTETETAVDEDNINSLEERIKVLRTEASQLTSADTFVQFARKTREANRLEKRLKELKGNDNALDGMIDIDKLAGAMSKALTRRATQSSRKWNSFAIAAKVLIRIIIVVAMWRRFSYGRTGSMRGQVISIDCRLLRPFSWVLRRQDLATTCAEDDWTCAAENVNQTCSVSYIMATALCNAAISFIADVLFKPIWR